MLLKVKQWADVCKIHWKEIISLAIALHWLMDLLIIIPLSLAIGYFFGIHIGEH
tara:strand:- start:1585 stop:1746 length:162 start_codon:yes stop_codon:yes gene_type:complete